MRQSNQTDFCFVLQHFQHEIGILPNKKKFHERINQCNDTRYFAS